MGTMFKFVKNDESRIFWVYPNGKATEYTATGKREETNFNTINTSLKNDGWKGNII